MSFEEHVGIGYCLYLLPNDDIQSPLLRLMVNARLKPGVSYDHSLFVIHRDALCASESLALVRMMPVMRAEVEEFLESTDEEKDATFRSVQHSLRESDVELRDNPAEVTFVVTAQTEIIGVVVLSRRVTSADDVHWLRVNYQLDDELNYDRHRGRSQAMITSWILNPIYSRYARVVLRDIMRLYYKTLLYFQSSKKSSPPPDMIQELRPVRPRKLIQPRIGEVQEFATRPTPYADGRESPLYFISKRLLTDPKIQVNKRVVVVGGGPSAMPLLEALCFSPKLHMNNLYLIAEQPPKPWIPATDTDNSHDQADYSADITDHGSKGGARTERHPRLSPVCDDAFSTEEVYASGLANRVTLAIGALTDIDRSNKAVVISGDVVLEYDVLVLAPGTQGEPRVKNSPFARGFAMVIQRVLLS